ncbi:MAG: glycosyltransferase family 4 protein, partial [Deltaproteobacteria bacterium]|nr:glycosyltransferase family 4 protein [Deltaproteobacteria bacterium]
SVMAISKTLLQPALYYSAESYSIRGRRLMGRQAAGEAFLRAFVDFYSDRPVHVLLHSPKDAALVDDELRRLGSVLPARTHSLADLHRAGFSLLYLPGPGIGELARQRLWAGERKFSLCGVTHTIASHRAMECIVELLTEPVRPWDALICTSTSVKRSVELLLAEQAEYLKWKLGATRFETPQLPVIPLGVHCRDFRFEPGFAQTSRQSLGIAEDDVVALFVGRLSFHAKAHPHPMLMACQHCAKHLPSGRKLHLIQCGWFANGRIEEAFGEIERYLAPDVVHHHLDGRKSGTRRQAWASADIFVSFSDNVQETFGLTPIEAMAAGLPVLVSDWDGYRDTVTHGETGFCVRTLAPPPGNSRDVARRYDLEDGAYDRFGYDKYCGRLCAMVGVDVPEARDSLLRLVLDPDLRRKMGEAGRRRAESVYDWQHIMRRYVELWEELENIRALSVERFGGNPCREYPARMDPLSLFADYPSCHVRAGVRCRNVTMLDETEHGRLTGLKSHSFAQGVIPTFQLVAMVQEQLEKDGDLGAVLALACSDEERRDMERAVAWLHKVGALALE